MTTNVDTQTDGFDPAKHLTNLNPSGAPRMYMEVKWRLAWLRAEQPNAMIRTTALSIDDKMAVILAEIELPSGAKGSGIGMAEKEGSSRYAGRYVEKAETAALGRACATLGYGTQFTDTEYEDSQHPADTPIDHGPQSGERVFKAKYRGDCYECGFLIKVGEDAVFNPESRLIRHPQGQCKEFDDEPEGE